MVARLGEGRGGRGARLIDRERHGLRGARSADWAALARRLDQNLTDEARRAGAAGLIATLRGALTPLTDMSEPSSAAKRARALALALETLTTDSTGALGRLWGGAGGEALEARLIDLERHGLRGARSADWAALTRLLDLNLTDDAPRAGASGPTATLRAALHLRNLGTAHR